MQSGNLTVVAEIWMRLCTISIPDVKASTSRVLATLTINKRHWGLSFTAHEKTMGRIKKDNQYFNHMKVINPSENKGCILLVILMLCYWLVWKNASVFNASKNRTCRIFLSTRDAGFQQDRSFNSRARRAQTLDQFISRYEFIEFPVRIYYDTCSFQSTTIILEPMSSPKGHCSGDDHRVPVWTSSSEVGHDISEGSYELPETKFAKQLKDENG